MKGTMGTVGYVWVLLYYKTALIYGVYNSREAAIEAMDVASETRLVISMYNLIGIR